MMTAYKTVWAPGTDALWWSPIKDRLEPLWPPDTPREEMLSACEAAFKKKGMKMDEHVLVRPDVHGNLIPTHPGRS